MHFEFIDKEKKERYLYFFFGFRRGDVHKSCNLREKRKRERKREREIKF